MFQLSLPTKGINVPARPEWLHEVKHDGCRLLLIRERGRVRLITRGGNDWTKRFPWIVEAACRIHSSQFVIDGEAVVLGVDGISTRCTRASMTTRCSSMRSTCWPATARITASCR
jgi:ATP-dependent DNA ligase